MTRKEAEKFARSCLYNYDFNVSLIAQKILKIETLSSCKGVEYRLDDRGKASVWYIEPFPEWLEHKEFLESELLKLQLITDPITSLIADISKGEHEVFKVWDIKFNRKLGWAAAVNEANKLGITENMFRTRFYKITYMAIRYLDLDIGNVPES